MQMLSTDKTLKHSSNGLNQNPSSVHQKSPVIRDIFDDVGKLLEKCKNLK